MADKRVEPSIASQSFNCPHCGAHSHQTWYDVFAHPITKDQGTPWRPDAEMIERIKKDREIDAAARAAFIEVVRRRLNSEVFLVRAEGTNLYSPPQVHNVAISICYTCEKPSLWVNDRVLHPPLRFGIGPNVDLPADVLR